MSDFHFEAYGGLAGTENAESGGAGTAFIYALEHTHRTLILDNDDRKCADELNIITNYADLSDDGCRTWVLPDSGGKLLIKL